MSGMAANGKGLGDGLGNSDSSAETKVKLKIKARDSMKEHIYERIQFEVGHQLSRKKAEAILKTAYERCRSYGYCELESNLYELIELASTLLAVD